MQVLLLETIYLPRLGLTMQDLHFMSSLFLGLTVCFIPFVVAAEREALKNLRSTVFLLLGAGVVVGLILVARPRRALACWWAWLSPSVLSAPRCKSTAAR